ncbi:uncharacterized protein LOC142563764 isoform X3 [Dermacentor variabilis]|uniref:uncharacterized protein LOC142563764 isoform X3 n=1 Tax=Dermacentor variabilis TaxID=34621 RepID=UPI003F5AE447
MENYKDIATPMICGRITSAMYHGGTSCPSQQAAVDCGANAACTHVLRNERQSKQRCYQGRQALAAANPRGAEREGEPGFRKAIARMACVAAMPSPLKDYLARQRGRSVELLLTSRKMIFLSCIFFVTFTSPSTGTLTKVKKIVSGSDPVVLLWGEFLPKNLMNRRCWRSTYIRAADKGGVSVTLHSNWIENANSDDARRKRNW